MKVSHIVRTLWLAAPRPILGRAALVPLTAAIVLLGSAPRMEAQASSGITGTVTDSTGAIVPNANVTILNVATQITVTAVTSSAGTYAATGLMPGRYTVTVSAPNFSTTVKNDVTVEVTTQATVDFTLNAGSTSETVEVSAPLIALNTTQPELGTTIEPAVVAALPVAIGGGRTRQIDQLQFLAPGTQGSTFSHQVNGGVNFEEEILYNGIPVPQSETAGYTTNFNPPFELINEFRVERATFSARYGLAQGAVTYQTASGTNKLHGDAFYNNRNEFFDARGFYNTVTPIDRENNNGFTVGGPVVLPHLYNGKDRTFFTFALDFGKSNSTNTSLGTVPTAQEKTGDFSDFVDANGNLVPIYDPTTGQQFPGNIIPAARISPLSASIIPNIPNPDRPGLVNNKNAVANAYPYVQHIWGFSIDHNLTSKQSLHFAEWRNTFTDTGFDNAPIVPATNLLQSTRYFPNLGSVWLLNYVNALTPNLVLTAGTDWVGEINNQFNLKTGVDFAGVVPNFRESVFPGITFDGNNAPTSYGTGGGNSFSVNRKLGLAAVLSLQWVHGRNTFTFGGEARRSYQDDNECQTCGGQFNFSQRNTANPAALGTTGSSFASFLLGQVDSAQRIFANELSLRNLLIAPYIQDDIKINPKLTINLGLRWDIMLPFTEKNNQIVFLDPNGINPAAGGLPGIATRFSNAAGGVNRADIDYKNFGPRLGVAYAINEKTVIQAGFNISYLNGGSYEYGTSKVATQYGNHLQQWNANLQREMPWNTFFQIAYIGNHAVRVPGQLNPISQGNPSVLLPYGALLKANINDPAAIAAGIKSPYAGFATDLGGNATVARALSPFPQYNYVYNNFDNTGSVTYSGLQLSLEKRLSNGLSFLTSYTLSRTLGNVDTAFGTFAAQSENKYNQYPEYTVSGSDIRNSAKVSGLYELPIGPGKHFVNNKGIAGQVLGGITIGFTTQYYTGTPFGAGENNNNPLGCNGCFNRPNRVEGVKLHTSGYTGLGTFKNGISSHQVFTTDGFASTSNEFVLGNAQRNYTELRNPGYYDEDIKASKKFALGERVSFSLEMNYFNLLNRVQHENPDSNVDDTNYGYVTSGQQNTQRQGQLGGRITF